MVGGVTVGVTVGVKGGVPVGVQIRAHSDTLRLTQN